MTMKNQDVPIQEQQADENMHLPQTGLLRRQCYFMLHDLCAGQWRRQLHLLFSLLKPNIDSVLAPCIIAGSFFAAIKMTSMSGENGQEKGKDGYLL